ncbi:MAG: DoxX family membrane protein [Ilumatobacter sp.]|nr:DoxX family membrane protein [Ilumatobacter sp.]
MNAVAVVASVLLGVVFVVAGASKLAAGEQWRTNARDLGAPDVAAAAVPWIELVIGALLIVQLWVPWPAIAAAITLVAFSTLLAVRIAQGDRPSCACFGQWSASPIGPAHLARNTAFLALAVLAAFA